MPAAAGACSGAGAVAGCPSPAPDGEGVGVAAAGVVAGCPSPAAGGEGAGVAAAGAALAGAGGDCGDGEGAVCANAPAQSDEINKEVDASRRGRNDTEAPCREIGNFHTAVCTNWRMQPDRAGDGKVNSPNSPSPATANAVPVIGAILRVVYDVVNNCAYYLLARTILGPVTLTQKYYSAIET